MEPKLRILLGRIWHARPACQEPSRLNVFGWLAGVAAAWLLGCWAASAVQLPLWARRLPVTGAPAVCAVALGALSAVRLVCGRLVGLLCKAEINLLDRAGRIRSARRSASGSPASRQPLEPSSARWIEIDWRAFLRPPGSLHSGRLLFDVLGRPPGRLPAERAARVNLISVASICQVAAVIKRRPDGKVGTRGLRKSSNVGESSSS